MLKSTLVHIINIWLMEFLKSYLELNLFPPCEPRHNFREPIDINFCAYNNKSWMFLISFGAGLINFGFLKKLGYKFKAGHPPKFSSSTKTQFINVAFKRGLCTNPFKYIP